MSGPVRIEVPTIDALLDTDATADYPHTAPMLSSGLATYLENQARTRDREPTVEVEVAVASGKSDPSAETSVRNAVHAYYAAEAELADLDLAVNQREGWISFRVLIPPAIVVGILAGLSYTFFPELVMGFIGFVFAVIIAGTCVVVAWIWVWDPIEKVSFNPVFLRARSRALRKLSTANLRFVYGSSAAPPN